jgi:hypothetical protein
MRWFLVLTAMLSMVPTSVQAQNTDLFGFRWIGIAMGQYADKEGVVPQNICAKDKDGKLILDKDRNPIPLLSWRVAILRYGTNEDLALYRRLHLNERWDSPYNLKVAETVPLMYRDSKGGKFTPFLGLSGPTAAFSKKPRKVDPVGAQCHSAVVMVDKSDVFWTEPRDLPSEDAEKTIRNPIRWIGNCTWALDTRGGLLSVDRSSPIPVMQSLPSFKFPKE